MRFSYLCFSVAFVCLVATAGYRDAWVAVGVFAGVGAILLWFERRARRPLSGPSSVETGYWQCPVSHCHTMNPPMFSHCSKCGAVKP